MELYNHTAAPRFAEATPTTDPVRPTAVLVEDLVGGCDNPPEHPVRALSVRAGVLVAIGGKMRPALHLSDGSLVLLSTNQLEPLAEGLQTWAESLLVLDRPDKKPLDASWSTPW